MRISLGELAARLERGIGEEVLRRAAERGAGVLAEGVRARLSGAPGGAHEAPWVESGALRDSIGVAVEGDAGGARAVVGSSDPAAVPQEMGTARVPARPFLGPAAAEMGEETARVVGRMVAAGLRGEEVGGGDEEGGDGGGEPGIMLASATGTDTERSLLTLIALVLLYQLLHGRSADPPRTTTPSGPTIVEQLPPEDKKDAPPANLAKPGEATLSEDRRRHILDGDGKSGGHGPGRNTPNKSEFPSDWSDEKVIDAVKDVANDPASVRTPAGRGRTYVNGTRDGVDIRVIIGADGKAIVTAYPTNVPQNPGR